jgi:hypothetical protein
MAFRSQRHLLEILGNQGSRQPAQFDAAMKTAN